MIAGIFIGIAAIANLKVGGEVLGAFLFSTGLIAVLRFEAELFTGIGDSRDWRLENFGNLDWKFIRNCITNSFDSLYA